VQAAFEVAEQHRHRLDPLFVGQVLEPLFPDLVRINALLALFLRLQIQFFQFVIRQSQKIPQFVGQCISFFKWKPFGGPDLREPIDYLLNLTPRQSKLLMGQIKHSYGKQDVRHGHDPCGSDTLLRRG